MATFTATYLVAWVAIGAYAARLVLGNRRLLRRLSEVEVASQSRPRDVTQAQTAA
jgi:CcmD family protein